MKDFFVSKEQIVAFELVVSQGRIADRSGGAIPGAALTAAAIRDVTGLTPVIVGTASAPKIDDWSSSLPKAKETLQALQRTVSDILNRGDRPLVVANTCSASLATLPIVAKRNPNAVILWIDAHGDFNTPQTTESGYLGGMVLAAACGRWDSGLGSGVEPTNVMVVGARDIDPAEEELLRQSGVRVVPPADVSPQKILPMIGDASVWIHVDWDVLEPGYVPAAYAIGGGLTPDTLRAIFELVPNHQIAGIELAEFESSGDPVKDAASLDHLIHAVLPLLPAK
ncbi:arginase family protein [Rhizobium sp. BR 314]|uniref:arginase family protein n=1 Tax=Rhizobium sp. BR 314 TaxID=3040013 RepID=UPI0039BFCB40